MEHDTKTGRRLLIAGKLSADVVELLNMVNESMSKLKKGSVSIRSKYD